MADESPLDPAKLMRAFFTAWDQGRAPAAAARAPEEAPADMSSIAPAMRLMAQALAIANMPSREEVSGLATRLDRIEALLARIDDRLTRIENAPPAAARKPPRKKH